MALSMASISARTSCPTCMAGCVDTTGKLLPVSRTWGESSGLVPILSPGAGRDVSELASSASPSDKFSSWIFLNT